MLNGEPAILSTMLNYGANHEAKTPDGITSLDLAIARNNAAAIQILRGLEAKA